MPVVAFIHSDSIKQIVPAMLAAQRKLKQPVMDSKNPHFGNPYASLGACLESAKEAFNAQDILIVQTYSQAEYGSVALTTLALHKSGEYIGGTCVIPCDRSNAQGYGSAATYARRYGLSGLAMLVAEHDDDGEVASQTEAKAPAAAKAPQKKLSIFGGK
jgi:hypothetical protein